MKKGQKQTSRGAITIFLAIILVPCIIFTCAFGDVSRVALSKSQANATGDLALYSQLANYDVDLHEWYGLVASCQDIESFYKKTEDYFVGMMSAKGVDGASSELVLSYLNDIFNGKDYTDFLQVEFLEAPKVSMVENGSMENPALLENGIVEFMKYRGIPELGARIIDHFKTLGVSGVLEDASEDDPIVKKKQDVAEKEAEMMEELLHTYLLLINYSETYHGDDNESASGVPLLAFSEFQNTYPEELKYIREDYKGITDLITNYYAFYYGKKSFDYNDFKKWYGRFPSASLPYIEGEDEDQVARYDEMGGGDFTVSFDKYWNGLGAYKNDEDEFEISEDVLLNDVFHSSREDVYSTLNGYCNNISTAADTIVNATGIPKPSGWQGDINEVLYCIRMADALSSCHSDFDTIKNNGNYMLQMYAKILIAEQCVLPEVGPNEESWSSRLSTAKSTIESCYHNYLTYSDSTSTFEDRLTDFQYWVDTTYPYLEQCRYMFTHKFGDDQSIAREDFIGTYNKLVKEKYGKIDELVQTQIKTLETVLNGGKFKFNGKEYEAVSLDELEAAIQKYKDSRDAWGEESYAHSTPFAKDNQEEYEASASSGGGSNTDAQDKELQQLVLDLSDEDVEELRTRVTNILNDLRAFHSALQSFTYGEQTIYNFEGRNEIIKAGLKVISDDPSQLDITKANNDTKVDENYKNLISPSLDSPVYSAPKAISGVEGNEPDLDKENLEPRIYELMKIKVPPANLKKVVDEKDKADSDREEGEKKADEKEKEAKGYSNKYLYGIGTDPGKAGGKSFGAGSFLTSIVSLFTKIVDDNFDEFRDQLYVVEYCMDMFSYSSYNNEGQHHLAQDADKFPASLEYSTTKGKEGYGEDYKKAWDNAEGNGLHYGKGKADKIENVVTKFDNRTLTNFPINNTKNKSNLAEIEYILYGKGTNKENLEAAYGDIFTIRFALNLISGFQNFYSPGLNDTADAINFLADFIMGITCGIVPAPLVKCIVIAIMAVAESALDLQRLKAGVPVVLYKTSDSRWYIKIPSVKSIGKAVEAIFKDNKDANLEPKDKPGEEDVVCPLYYSDYMYLFMLIAANDSGIYPQMLKRIGNLIENNMNMGKGENDTKFEIKKAQVFFQLKAKIRVKPLFLALPIANSVESVDTGSVLEATDWCTYDINVIRGYS